jgi:hypothetical protein
MGDSERDSFLTAINTLYAGTNTESLMTFGPKFKPIEYFVTKHLIGSASKSCDSWHDDAGMANHHSALSLEFEQSLQAVDRTVLDACMKFL